MCVRIAPGALMIKVMFPIFSVLSVVFALIQAITFLKLKFSYRKTKSELTEKLSKIFLFLSIFWGSIGFPTLFFSNLKLIQFCVDLGFFFSFLAMAYFFFLPFKIYFNKQPPRSLFFTIIIIGMIFLIFNFLNLKPAFIYFRGPFVFYAENRNLLVNSLSGFLGSSISLLSGIFFWLGGLKSKEREIRLRAFLFSASAISTSLATGVRFFLIFLFDIFVSTSLAYFFSSWAILFSVLAVFFVKPTIENP